MSEWGLKKYIHCINFPKIESYYFNLLLPHLSNIKYLDLMKKLCIVYWHKFDLL